MMNDDQQVEDRVRAVLPGRQRASLDAGTRQRIARRIGLEPPSGFRWLLFATAVAASAAVFILAITLRPAGDSSSGAGPVARTSPTTSVSPSPTPAATATVRATQTPPDVRAAMAFGRLPGAADSSGAAAGSFLDDANVTYRLADGVSSFAHSETGTVRRARFTDFTASDASRIAANFGIGGPPAQHTSPTGLVSWLWQLPSIELEVDSDGRTQVNVSPEGRPGDLTQQEKITTATGWLADHGMLPPNAAPGATVVGQDVVFTGTPGMYGPQFLPFPLLNVTFNEAGQITHAFERWANVDALSDYPLAGADGVMKSLARHYGHLQADTPWLTDAPSGPSLVGVATIQSIDPAINGVPVYPDAESMVVYLEPAYVLHGILELSDGHTTTFTVKVPAVDPDWVR